MRCLETMLCDSAGRTIIKSFHSRIPAQKRTLREHHHTECELSVFLKGRGVYFAHGISYPFEQGDVFLFGSNEAHCITEVYEEMDLLNIHFEPKLLWERSENIDLLNLFAARSKSFSNRFAAGDTTLYQKILELESELHAQKECHAILARGLLFSALVHMIRHYDCIDKEKSITAHSSSTGSLRNAIHYINENIDAHLTLKELADVACMTPTYFSSVFKKYNGISPWEYITIKRVERAVEMLKTTDLTKLEIAERCGFSSSSNFYKAFFRITGKHPGDFSRG